MIRKGARYGFQRRWERRWRITRHSARFELNFDASKSKSELLFSFRFGTISVRDLSEIVEKTLE